MTREQAIQKLVQGAMNDVCAYEDFVADCVKTEVKTWGNDDINDWFGEQVID